MEAPLTAREIALIEQMGTMRHLVDLQNDIILCLVVRLGGAAKIDNRDRDYHIKTYTLEKTVRTDDLTADININARLK